MIQNLRYKDKMISWNCDNKEICIQNDNNVKNIIFNEQYVLAMFAEKDSESLILYDENGEIVNKVFGSDELYIMYLQHHPKFGLCAVCSAKENNNSWLDSYYSFNENGTFVKCTFSR